MNDIDREEMRLVLTMPRFAKIPKNENTNKPERWINLNDISQLVIDEEYVAVYYVFNESEKFTVIEAHDLLQIVRSQQ